MHFLDELLPTVGEGALVLELALATNLPVATHLCLLLHLVLSHEVVSLSIIAE